MLQCAPSFVLLSPGETESHLDCIRQEGEWHSLMPFIFPRAGESPESECRADAEQSRDVRMCGMSDAGDHREGGDKQERITHCVL